MVAPLMLAAGGAALGGVMSYKGSMAQARQQQQIAEYNAKLAENEAIIAARAKVDEEERLRKQSERLAGTQRVTTAASGIEMSGSPLQALADTYFSMEKDALRIQYASDIEQTQKQSEATMARLEGKARSAASRSQAYSSLIQGGTQAATLLG